MFAYFKSLDTLVRNSVSWDSDDPYYQYQMAFLLEAIATEENQ